MLALLASSLRLPFQSQHSNPRAARNLSSPVYFVLLTPFCFPASSSFSNIHFNVQIPCTYNTLSQPPSSSPFSLLSPSSTNSKVHYPSFTIHRSHRPLHPTHQNSTKPLSHPPPSKDLQNFKDIRPCTEYYNTTITR